MMHLASSPTLGTDTHRYLPHTATHSLLPSSNTSYRTRPRFTRQSHSSVMLNPAFTLAVSFAIALCRPALALPIAVCHAAHFPAYAVLCANFSFRMLPSIRRSRRMSAASPTSTTWTRTLPLRASTAESSTRTPPTPARRSAGSFRAAVTHVLPPSSTVPQPRRPALSTPRSRR
jgi:hypothetical protein